MQEVSRARSTPTSVGERSEPKLLDPQYIVGFVDGEGCFCVSVSKHKTLKRRIEVRPEFEIEVRADDRLILERIQKTLQCGTIYDLKYDRYGWKPHAKYKVSNIGDLKLRIIPFFEHYLLQAKKSARFKFFKTIVDMIASKRHLTYEGFQKIIKLRDQMRQIGKKT